MPSQFGVLLKEFRRRAGLTQQDLERASGITDRTIRRLEKETDPNPQLETVRLLADALDLDPAEHARLMSAAGAASAPEPPVSHRVAPPVDPVLAAAADDLANAVAARCRREEELRRIQDPVPLAVRWRTAPDELTDHWENVVRARLGSADVEPLPLAGELSEVVDVYRRIPSGRLVVLGRAGSGKTVLAVRFVLDVLAGRRSGDVVPVLVSLGSWDPVQAGLRDWLTAQLERDNPGLTATGKDGTTLAAALVARDRVLPVLDGFDEIAEGLHRVALEELNATTMPLVLTSRPHDYAMAVARTDVLTAAAGVEVTDLTVPDLADYLPRTTRRSATGWDAVLTELREHPHGAAGVNLHAVLTTPLMVALARATYSDTPDRDPAELLDTTRFPTPEAVEDHLLSSFTTTAYRDGRPGRWEPERVGRWLRYLAGHLHRLGRRDLAWWELGTSISLPRRMLVVGLAGGAAVGLVNLCAELALTSVRRALFDSVLVALFAGLVLGLLHGVVVRSVPVALQPSAARIRLRGARRSQRRLGTRMRFGAVAGVVLGSVFGLLRELVLARLSGVSRDLPGIVGDVVLCGLVFAIALGLAAATVAALEAPLDVKSVVSPADLLRTNRSTMLVQLLVFGVVFAAIIAVGSWSSVWLLEAAGLGRPFGLLLSQNVVLLFVGGLISGLGGGLGYVFGVTAWGQWVVLARVWLPLTGRLPWALTAFLDDACSRGLLRQSGAVHQFRHARLQDHLTGADRL